MNEIHEAIAQYMSDWLPRTTVFSLTGGTVQQVLGVNPERVGLFFWSTSIGPYRVGPDVQITTNRGIIVNDTVPPVVLVYEKWGGIVSGPWWAGSVGPVTTNLTELFYRPRGEWQNVP